MMKSPWASPVNLVAGLRVLAWAFAMASWSVGAQPAALEVGFDAGAGPTRGIGTVRTGPDGLLYVGGAFEAFSGHSNRLVRLQATGAVDTGFQFGGVIGSSFFQAQPGILDLAWQADGKLLVGGNFLWPRQHIARFHADGSPDTVFNAGPALSDQVLQILPLTDGSILVVGGVNVAGGTSRGYVRRLLADGSFDPAFAITANGSVNSLALQSDGKIVVVGAFTHLNEVQSRYLARLHPDGILDRTFDIGTGPDYEARAVAQLDDGRLLLQGTFTNFNGVLRPSILRLHRDGRLDPSFQLDPAVFPPAIQRWGVQRDGRILVAGTALSSDGLIQQVYARLNGDGTLDPSFAGDPALSDSVRGFYAQADGKIVIFGTFATVQGLPRARIARLLGGPSSAPILQSGPASQSTALARSVHLTVTATAVPAPSYHWHKDGQWLSVSDAGVLYLPRVQPADAGRYSVLVSNALGIALSDDAILTVGPAPDFPGAPEATFEAPRDLRGRVKAMAVAEDGRILVGGTFTNLDGIHRGRVALLESDGRLVAGFDAAGGANGTVNAVSVGPPEGGWLVGGVFSNFAGVPRRLFAALTANGALATNHAQLVFNASATSIEAFVRQPDGRVLVGGSFTNVAGFNTRVIARLHEDGTVDQTFSNSASATPFSLAFQPDGGVITLNRLVVSRRLHSGAADPAFNDFGTSGLGEFFAVATQPDGGILVGGSRFSTPAAARFVRLHPDGRVDTNFSAVVSGSLDGNRGQVSAIVVQGDGAILIGGNFTTVNGASRNGLARLNRDGTLDTTFEVGRGLDLPVTGLSVQEDGRILVAGQFLSFDGLERPGLMRLQGGPYSAPSILQQPTNQTVDFGKRVTLSVVALGLPAPVYRWRVDGSELPEVKGPTLEIPSAHTNDARGYSVVISNALGVLTSAVARLTVLTIPPSFVRDPADVSILAGLQTNITVGITGLPLPSVQWFKDGFPVTGATNLTVSFGNILDSDQGAYAAVASNLVGVVTSQVAQVTVLPAIVSPGTPVAEFSPGTGPNGPITGVQFHQDGMLAAGTFTSVDGVPRSGLVRLNPGGGVDLGFAPVVTGGAVAAMVVAGDGRILIAGSFTNIGGVPRARVARLREDGTLDPEFDPASGPNGAVTSMRVLPDGRIVIGGSFTSVNGVARAGLAWLWANGALDLTTVPPSGVAGLLGVQPDGSVLTRLSGRVARVIRDGTLDPSFNSPTFNGTVAGAEAMPDGRIVVHGSFTSPRSQLARLMPDGQVDAVFNPGNPSLGSVLALAAQADGRIVVGGTFVAVGTTSANRLVRLRWDGSVDASFGIGSGVTGGFTAVNALAQREDGAVLVGGDFTQVNGYPRRNLALVHGGPASPPQVLAQPPHQTVLSGQAIALGASILGWPQPAYQWQFHGTNLPGATNAALFVGRAQMRDAGPYQLRASNSEGTAESQVANVTVIPQPIQTGGPDGGFYAGQGPNERVSAIALQPDGRVLIGGRFTRVDGMPRPGLARLREDGSLDESFDPGTGVGPPGVVTISAIAVLPDGRVVVGGNFTSYNGVPRLGLAGLQPDGRLDEGFGSGVGGSVTDLRLQPDGRLLVGGLFSTVHGVGRTNVARLNPDGSVDLNFNRGRGPNGAVRALALESDGHIVLAGSFTAVDGRASIAVARLQVDGTLVPGYFSSGPILPASHNEPCHPFPQGSSGNAPLLTAVAALPDGKAIVAGAFTSYGGFARSYLVRLNSNGSVDTNFIVSPAPDAVVNTVALQPDGKILIGGCFSTVGGVPCPGLARLHRDGTVDSAFGVAPGLTSAGLPPVGPMAIQPDGRILVGGSFLGMSGFMRRHLIRLQGDLRLLRPGAVAPAGFGAQVATMDGRIYWLESASSIPAAEWIPGPSLLGDGAVRTLMQDTNGAPRQFYRLRVE